MNDHMTVPLEWNDGMEYWNCHLTTAATYPGKFKMHTVCGTGTFHILNCKHLSGKGDTFLTWKELSCLSSVKLPS